MSRCVRFSLSLSLYLVFLTALALVSMDPYIYIFPWVSVKIIECVSMFVCIAWFFGSCSLFIQFVFCVVLVSFLPSFNGFSMVPFLIILVLRFRTIGITRCNGLSDSPRPCHESFQALIAILKAFEPSFKRLQENPQTTGKHRHRPSNKEQQENPYHCHARIATHDLIVWIQKKKEKRKKENVSRKK